MALIDQADLKLHNSALSIDFELESIQSFLDDVYEKHLIPAIGRVFFNELVANKANYGAESKEKAVLLLLQKAAVGFAVHYYSNFGAVQISNAGIFVAKSDKNLPASDKKLLELRKQTLSNGYTFLEFAVDYLEANIADFESYSTSSAHASNRSLFINSSAEYPQKVRVSPELFYSIKGIQAAVEQDYIEGVLGSDLTATMREAILENALIPAQELLLVWIRKAVASLTISEAIPYRLVSIDGTGAYVSKESIGGTAGNIENRDPAEMNRLRVTMNRLSRDGASDLERLRLWLNDHTADFPTYTKSTESVMTKINDDPASNVYFM